MPSVPNLLRYASELERERDHALRPPGDPEEADLLAAAERTESEPDEPAGQFTALASEADFDRVVFDGGEFGLPPSRAARRSRTTSGCPGSSSPTRSRTLLRRHQARHQPGSAGAAPVSAHAETLRELRKELNGLVAAWHHRTDQPHGVIHAELRSACGGPPSAIATADELRQRIDQIRRWAINGRRR